MARFKKIPMKTRVDKVYYSNSIVEDVVKLSVAEIPLVKLYPTTSDDKASIGACIVNFDKDGVKVDVAVKIHYMLSVSETAFKIQEAIRHNVESMTEHHLAKVNVKVCDVFFDEITDTNSAEVDKNNEELKNDFTEDRDNK